jgi:hypothetical protein
MKSGEAAIRRLARATGRSIILLDGGAPAVAARVKDAHVGRAAQPGGPTDTSNRVRPARRAR